MNDILILLTPEISAKYIMICSIENEWRFGFVRGESRPGRILLGSRGVILGLLEIILIVEEGLRVGGTQGLIFVFEIEILENNLRKNPVQNLPPNEIHDRKLTSPVVNCCCFIESQKSL